jgi:biopolymer transport protein ExbB
MNAKNPRHPVRLLLTPVLVLTALGSAWAQEEPPAAPPPGPPPAVEKSLLDLFNDGGPLMWPILLCSIGTIAVGVYCFLQINQKKMMPQSLVDGVSQAMQRHDANAAYE